MSTLAETLLNLSPEEKRNFVGFFELLLKVDKRVNPHLYPIKSLVLSNPLLWQDADLQCKVV